MDRAEHIDIESLGRVEMGFGRRGQSGKIHHGIGRIALEQGRDAIGVSKIASGALDRGIHSGESRPVFDGANLVVCAPQSRHEVNPRKARCPKDQNSHDV